MPSDDYASFSGGGALKLKGGKIGKNKKKKKDKASDLERSLSTGGSGSEAKPDPEKKRAKSKAVVSAGRASVPYAGPINYGWPRRGISPADFTGKTDQVMQPRALSELEREINAAIRRRHLT